MSTTVPVIQKYAASSSGSDSTDILDLKKDEGWEDVEAEEEPLQILSLLDEKTFSDVESMLDYCKKQYSFDFLAIRDKLSLDFYALIKLVNFIRSEVKSGRSITGSVVAKEDFEHDKYLQPVLPDDQLLFSLDDLPESKGTKEDELVSRVAELEEELRKTQSQFSEYRNTVKETLDARWNEKSTEAQSGPSTEEKRDDDSHYFSSYSYNDIHEVMLKDSVRTDSYRDFIYNNKNLFAGKTVLDVGCGTGILSMFCAKAGAAKVIAVDNSAIIDKARENVFTNGFSSVITLLHGKMEEVVLPVDKVDIIVSEWMGYCLLYEAMLDSVIWARDRYLKPDGLMVPSHMNMFIAPAADPDYTADHVAWWRDVYGFDMKAMQAGIYNDAQVMHMPSSTICAKQAPFMQLSLHTTTVKDLVFKRKVQFQLNKDVDSIDSFVIWFDTFFLPSRNDEVPESAQAEEWSKNGGKGVAFTTGPFEKETHWKQGVLLIDSLKAAEGAKELKEGEVVDAEIEYSVASDNSRALDLIMKWSSKTIGSREQKWEMR